MTDKEKCSSTPIVVIFGGAEYKVEPLAIMYSREWREKVVRILKELPKYAKATTEAPDEFAEALQALLIAMPDIVIELFFDYAKNLKRDEIERIATDEEMAKAFEQVVQVAFPLAQSLVGALGKLGQNRIGT